MKKITCFLFSALFASCASNAEEKTPCWVSGDSSRIITSQEAMLKTYLLAINLDDPKGDAKKRLSHGDYRLIGVGGIGLEYPSLDLSKEGHILCEFGGRYIQGTSDVYESEAHAHLSSKFAEYARSYNIVVIQHYNRKK